MNFIKSREKCLFLYCYGTVKNMTKKIVFFVGMKWQMGIVDQPVSICRVTMNSLYSFQSTCHPKTVPISVFTVPRNYASEQYQGVAIMLLISVMYGKVTDFRYQLSQITE